MCKVIAKTKDMPKEEWLKLRKQGIGGSDAGAVCGVNPYSSPMKVFRDKTSDETEEINNEAVRQGNDLEDYVAQRFMEAAGKKVRRSNAMYRSEKYPFMIADVDRLVVGEDAGLERREEILAQMEKLEEEKRRIEQEVKLFMRDNERASSGKYHVSWGSVDTARFDTKRFKEEKTEIYRDYAKVSSSRRFQVKVA